MSMLFKLFHEKEREGMIPNLFYEANITMIPKLDKGITKKKKIIDEHRSKTS
jgi:hypothetical protein